VDFSSAPDLRDLADTLRPIARQAARVGIRWALIGAAARDLLLRHRLARRATRRTEDADVAILVQSWEEHDALRRGLVEQESARPHATVKQRAFLGDGSIDIVPCGAIEEEGIIAWRPDGDPRLDVRGLSESIVGATPAILPGPLEVPVVSLEHFIGLKLLAWRDRHLRLPMHDSADLGDVLVGAGDLVPLDTLYDDHAEDMAASEFDPARAALLLVGRRLRESWRATAATALADTLRGELDPEGRLELLRELRRVPAARELLRAMLRGLEAA
jgi:predicted nucleotidyltransferase